MLAFVTGCQGLAFTEAEVSFVRDSQPFGLILFSRNCETPGQVRALTDAFRQIVGRSDAPILIDQEGGRVQRLRPPHWPSLPPAGVFESIDAHDPEAAAAAARLAGEAIGLVLTDLGVSADCAPVCDIRFPETHGVIGDRAFGSRPERVAVLAGAFADGLLAAGIAPVIKHMPGHGRARVDSHFEPPIVEAALEDLEQDFTPFRLLRHLPAGMTAHVVYRAIDPESPGTLSSIIVEDVIRRHIGFDGLLFTDDLSMNALSGSVGERARRAWGAGVDVVLHCNGVLEEMEAVAVEAPALAGRALDRARRLTDVAERRSLV